MATDEGLAKIQQARRHIELLRDRREFITQRCASRKIDGHEASNAHDEDEIRALDWALPVLEAEWDNLCRLRRNVERTENRLANLERRGIIEDRGGPRVWEQAEAG